MSDKIYCREEATYQTPADAKMQVASGEVWGSKGRYGFEPTVRAYPWPLRAGVRGIQFTTTIAPDDESSPNMTRWYLTKTPGVQLRVKNGEDFACITAAVENFQP